MLGSRKAKEMKRRASRRKATHKTRLVALRSDQKCGWQRRQPNPKSKIGSERTHQINSERKQANEGIALHGQGDQPRPQRPGTSQ
jgi:hypothetical protein